MGGPIRTFDVFADALHVLPVKGVLEAERPLYRFEHLPPFLCMVKWWSRASALPEISSNPGLRSAPVGLGAAVHAQLGHDKRGPFCGVGMAAVKKPSCTAGHDTRIFP